MAVDRAQSALERSERRTAAACAALAFVAILAAILVEAGATGAMAGNDALRLINLSQELPGHLAGLLFLLVGLTLAATAHYLLCRAVRRRAPETSAWLERLAVSGMAAQGITHALAFAALARVADGFGAQDGPQAARAAMDGDALLRVAGVLELGGRVLLAVSVLFVALNAQRVGLLPPALGFWGLLTGVLALVLPVGVSMLLLWLACLAALLVGRWPGGLPPAWPEGRAISADELLRRRRQGAVS